MEFFLNNHCYSKLFYFAKNVMKNFPKLILFEIKYKYFIISTIYNKKNLHKATRIILMFIKMSLSQKFYLFLLKLNTNFYKSISC